MIDVHAHILPCDHGCESIDMALAQICLAQKHGIKAIIATPHYDCRMESVQSFLNRRTQAYEQLLSAMPPSNTVKIFPAAEVSLEHGIEELANLEQLCIGQGKHILIELSKDQHGDWAYEALFALERRGLRPIIAHIHRYDRYTIEKLMALNFYAQINIECKHSRREWSMVKKWISERRVHFIGSDIHGASTTVYRDFSRFYKWLSKEEQKRFSANAEILIQ